MRHTSMQFSRRRRNRPRRWRPGYRRLVFWIVTMTASGSILLVTATSAVSSTQAGGNDLSFIEDQLNGQVDGVLGDLENQVSGFLDDIAGGLTSNLSGLVGGVFGNLGGAGGFLGQLISPIESLVTDKIGFYQDFLEDELGNLLGGVSLDHLFGGGGSDDSGLEFGTMGLPDLSSAPFLETILKDSQKGVAGDIQESDRYAINPVALSASLENEAERMQVRMLSGALLSAEGQDNTVTQIAETQAILEVVDGLATGAQEMDVTQDVMKAYTAVEANQAALAADQVTELIQLRQQVAANGVVAANISEGIDEMNRAARSESMAATSVLLRTASTFYLPDSVED